MRRSEMVEAIAEKLLVEAHIFDGDLAECEEVREQTKMYRLKVAHYALKAAEELGMLPPFSHEVFEKSWNKNRCPVTSSGNEWDEESWDQNEQT
jgi:hypothetical protein